MTNQRMKLCNLLLFLIVLGTNTILFAQKQIITITPKVNEDNSVDFYYEKTKPGSYSVDLEFSNVNNCDINDYKTVIRGNSGTLQKLRPLDKTKGISYSFRYNSIMGDLEPKVDSLFRYTLPFKNQKKVKIYEAGNIGEKYYGQEKVLNWKSYVVRSQTPDTICSMRRGIVVDLINEYDESSSLNPEFTSKRNLVIIEHKDGTFAIYKGLKKNAVFVKLGQEIYPKTELGIMEKYDKGSYRLDFSVNYLFDKDFKSNKSQTLKNYKSNYKYIKPYFVTEEGEIQIESKNDYTTLFTDAVITQEFSKSEKKKYAKDPKLFK